MAVTTIEQGKIKGVLCDSKNGTYYAFKGIPYAKPPLGPLRFKAPQPPESWKGIRDASEHGPVCPQFNERLQSIETGSEDCLYLNVYSKSVRPTSPMPVMVWIHGGAYYTGSGNSDFYGPDFFMKHDVILVTFNYRLEVLGFLCLDNEEVPGNAGLKDQVAALRWVKNNISAFGGDTNNITIFGCSAGAASVSFHLISKMSNGLFNKAICQSGVCLNDWAYSIYGLQRAFQLGRLLGKDTEDTTELLEFLRNVPVSSLVNIKLPLVETNHRDITDSIFFAPVIEKSDLKVEKFITESPIDLVKRGSFAKVPLIVGYTSGEGIELGKSFPATLDFLTTLGAVVPRELKLKFDTEKLKDADDKIRNFYFKGKQLNADMIKEVVNLETDKLFAYNVTRFARYYKFFTSMPVYLYKMTVETERNFTKKVYKMEFIPGVCHADDLPYLFHITCFDIPLTKESKRVVEQFVQLWYNFASTGNPTSTNVGVEWKQFTDKERQCLIIDKTLKCILNIDAENMNLWENIFEETGLL
ncbi:juvenile hormone esterase-like [Vanessa atalanta]|uniref:juvenile hormone esterase-like n=1 Tax=Vanessa atalanta TaxID=42275 RepID=UPI001FCDCEC9|nr:juvenile hormone esterase-like [Vanessa atalanta]XP_047530630.1 juvenile hormone esterase-like [Vanessa atalanta]XP_047530631.1 juvenile hormone esterase-like [Vanessa atalanta]XP_047530632.1 juvenile hormone esterase-like [Vanessa atalanta]